MLCSLLVLLVLAVLVRSGLPVFPVLVLVLLLAVPVLVRSRGGSRSRKS